MHKRFCKTQWILTRVNKGQNIRSDVKNGIKVNTGYGKQGKQDIYKSSGIVQQFLKPHPSFEVQLFHPPIDRLRQWYAWPISA